MLTLTTRRRTARNASPDRAAPPLRVSPMGRPAPALRRSLAGGSSALRESRRRLLRERQNLAAAATGRSWPAGWSPIRRVALTRAHSHHAPRPSVRGLARAARAEPRRPRPAIPTGGSPRRLRRRAQLRLASARPLAGPPGPSGGAAILEPRARQR